MNNSSSQVYRVFGLRGKGNRWRNAVAANLDEILPLLRQKRAKPQPLYFFI
jgi:hypothetical protein